MNKLKIFIPEFAFGNATLIEIFVNNENGQVEISDLGASFFELVEDPKLADWILIPAFITSLQNESGKAYIQNSRDLALSLNKPLGVFSNSDLIINPGVEEVYIFTPGAYESIPNLVDLPATLPHDPLQKWFGGGWRPIGVNQKPSVGFCGQATRNPLKALKDFFKIELIKTKAKFGKSRFLKVPRFLPAWERGLLLHHLKKSTKLETNFLLRSQYKGGATTPEQNDLVEREFYLNIYENLFTICMRGFGNYSVRFFQTLSLGRIPVLIDTDSSIPFSKFISKEKFFVRVPYDDRKKTDDYLVRFLSEKSEIELIEFQKGCREVWEKYYQKEGLIRYLAEEMKSILMKKPMKTD